jgi:hypothetical protein
MKRVVFPFIAVVVAIWGLWVPYRAAAQVNYNDLMDDATFDNYNSMTAGQIDSFLNTFPSSCISTNNGFSAPNPIGYNPTSKFQFGSDVSAGTVIYNAAQAYGINPQVLITILQQQEGLVEGNGPNIVRNGTDCGALAIGSAMGYNCPDNLVLSSYSGFELYSINGVPITSVNNICVQNAAYVGFSQQVIIAAWQLTFDRHRSEGLNNWYVNKSSWNNSDDLNFCYSNRTIDGGPFYLCPDQVGHTNDPYIFHSGQYSIDGTIVTIANGATAAFYNYTPHLNGQTLFTNLFEGWFGNVYSAQSGLSVYAKSPCTIPYYNSASVGRLFQPDVGDYLYTTNYAEACYAVTLGFIWDGVTMQNIVSTATGAEPVYRIANPVHHLFTTDVSLMDQYLTNGGYHQEGIAFYAYATQQPGTIPVYCLVNGPTVLYTSAGYEATYMVNNLGFTNAGIAWYTPDLSSQQTQVYRLNRGAERLYTTSPIEESYAESLGFSPELNSFSAETEPDANDIPVYRISTPTSFFYTTSVVERDIAVVYDGYMSDGIGFYAVDPAATGAIPIYRITDSNGNRVFTPSLTEEQAAVQNDGYTSEGTAWYAYPSLSN